MEFEGGPEALEGLREAAGVPSLRAAQQQTGEELRNPVLAGTFGRDSRGEAPLERDEGTGGVREVQRTTPAVELDPSGAEAHGVPSARYRTVDRVRSTRYVAAVSRTSSGVTASTASRNVGNVSREPSTSSWASRNPWNVTPSAS